VEGEGEGIEDEGDKGGGVVESLDDDLAIAVGDVMAVMGLKSVSMRFDRDLELTRWREVTREGGSRGW